ncbi:DNA-binding transcriptional LysR family regulator [Bradyrhizobium sp. USDA 4341]
MSPNSKNKHQADLKPELPFKQASADWNLVRMFLEVARAGGIRAAAERLGVAASFLSKRIAHLEASYGTKLMTRHVDGIRLTQEGLQVFEAAQRMEQASFGLERVLRQSAPELTGEVRIAVTEGLGTMWLGRRMVEFQRVNPGLLIDVKCELRSSDVLRLEADVSVQLDPPTQPDAKRAKIAKLHVMPFVSPAYVELYGMPKDEADVMANHRVVQQEAQQTHGNEVYQQYAERGLVPKITMRNNLSYAHLWSVVRGAGIGWLPTYVPALGDPLIPLDIGHLIEFDVWITYHPEAKKIERVRKLIDWTIDSFDGRKYPWFRDEFIHPKEMQDLYRDSEPFLNLFPGFRRSSQTKVVPLPVKPSD